MSLCGALQGPILTCRRVSSAAGPLVVETDADLLELKRGNLLLEREKLNLEIQMLRAKLEKLN